jgi:hypothetical protein
MPPPNAITPPPPGSYSSLHTPPEPGSRWRCRTTAGVWEVQQVIVVSRDGRRLVVAVHARLGRWTGVWLGDWDREFEKEVTA